MESLRSFRGCERLSEENQDEQPGEDSGSDSVDRLLFPRDLPRSWPRSDLGSGGCERLSEDHRDDRDEQPGEAGSRGEGGEASQDEIGFRGETSWATTLRLRPRPKPGPRPSGEGVCAWGSDLLSAWEIAAGRRSDPPGPRSGISGEETDRLGVGASGEGRRERRGEHAELHMRSSHEPQAVCRAEVEGACRMRLKRGLEASPRSRGLGGSRAESLADPWERDESWADPSELRFEHLELKRSSLALACAGKSTRCSRSPEPCLLRSFSSSASRHRLCEEGGCGIVDCVSASGATSRPLVGPRLDKLDGSALLYQEPGEPVFIVKPGARSLESQPLHARVASCGTTNTRCF